MLTLTTPTFLLSHASTNSNSNNYNTHKNNNNLPSFPSCLDNNSNCTVTTTATTLLIPSMVTCRALFLPLLVTITTTVTTSTTTATTSTHNLYSTQACHFPIWVMVTTTATTTTTRQQQVMAACQMGHLGSTALCLPPALLPHLPHIVTIMGACHVRSRAAGVVAMVVVW